VLVLSAMRLQFLTSQTPLQVGFAVMVAGTLYVLRSSYHGRFKKTRIYHYITALVSIYRRFTTAALDVVSPHDTDYARCLPCLPRDGTRIHAGVATRSEDVNVIQFW